MDTRRYDTIQLGRGCLGPFFQHLLRFDSIDLDSIEVLRSLPQRSTFFPRRSDILLESGAAHTALILIEGMAINSKVLDDGCRQVVSILVPGDFINLIDCPPQRDYHSIQTLQDSRFVELSGENIKRLNKNTGILKSLLSATQIETAIARQWLIGLGRRSAEKRVAHLLCELYHRLRAVGGVDGDTYHLPLSLTDIADVVGLSTVHTCRAMRALAERGLLARRRGRNIQIDIERMSDIAAFDPAYLGPSVADSIRCSAQSVTQRSEDALLPGEICAGVRRHLVSA